MFACTGLALAGIGLYGLISFLVEERTREIGVRIALGATPSEVARLVVSDGMRWTAAGAVIGIAASAGLLRLLKGLLYQVALRGKAMHICPGNVEGDSAQKSIQQHALANHAKAALFH